MKKINSIDELKEGQKVYLEVNVTLLGNEETEYPVDLYTTYGTYLESLTSDFLLESDNYESEQNLFTFEPLEIGKEHKFSLDIDTWGKDTLVGYYTIRGKRYSFIQSIQPIQQNEEELKLFELAKKLGYKVEKQD